MAWLNEVGSGSDGGLLSVLRAMRWALRWVIKADESPDRSGEVRRRFSLQAQDRLLLLEPGTPALGAQDTCPELSSGLGPAWGETVYWGARQRAPHRW